MCRPDGEYTVGERKGQTHRSSSLTAEEGDPMAQSDILETDASRFGDALAGSGEEDRWPPYQTFLFVFVFNATAWTAVATVVLALV